MVCDELTSPHIDEDSAVVEFNREGKRFTDYYFVRKYKIRTVMEIL